MEIGAGNKDADIDPDPDLDRGITGTGRGSGVGIVHVRVHAHELTISEHDLTDGFPVEIVEDSAVLDIISIIIQSRIIVI